MSHHMPTTYFLIVIARMTVAHLTVPGPRITPFPTGLAGLVPLIAGTWLNLAADSTMKRHQTTIHPFEQTTALIEDGVFGHTRNPMYLGMVFILVGITIFLGSVTPWVFVVCFVIVIKTFFIEREEQKLESSFVDAFTNYRKRVRM